MPRADSAVVADAFVVSGCERGRLTPQTPWRTRQGLCGPLPVCLTVRRHETDDPLGKLGPAPHLATAKYASLRHYGT
jgi:hypothetical protein